MAKVSAVRSFDNQIAFPPGLKVRGEQYDKNHVMILGSISMI